MQVKYVIQYNSPSECQMFQVYSMKVSDSHAHELTVDNYENQILLWRTMFLNDFFTKFEYNGIVTFDNFRCVTNEFDTYFCNTTSFVPLQYSTLITQTATSNINEMNMPDALPLTEMFDVY